MVGLMLSAAFVIFLQPGLDAREIKHPPKVIIGIIQEVSSSTVKVEGRSYDISRAEVENVRGIPLTRDQLKKGEEVELWIEEGVVTSVIIQIKNHMMQ
jgi:hypothetical protein